jgi:hypothetical protein
MSSELSISLLQASLDNLIHWLASGKVAKTSEIYGLKLSGSSARLTQSGLWEKTYQGCSQLSLDGFSVQYYPTWSRWGTVLDGWYMGLVRSEPLTSENESLSWPTPTATESGFNRSNSPNAKIRPSLRMIARKGLWPTTAARDYRGAGSKEGYHRRRQGHQQSLNEEVVHGISGAGQGQLNPDWVESLMGFPTGWTDLSDGQQDQESHSTTGNLPGLSSESSKTEQSA